MSARPLSGAGTIDNLSGSGTSTLTVGNGNANSTFSGTIQNTAGTDRTDQGGRGHVDLRGPQCLQRRDLRRGGYVAVVRGP